MYAHRGSQEPGGPSGLGAVARAYGAKASAGPGGVGEVDVGAHRAGRQHDEDGMVKCGRCAPIPTEASASRLSQPCS